MDNTEFRYLEQLSKLYPTIGKASTEIINLQSILNLPKGTEHFLSDIHGEYEAFSHVLHNGSGAVRKKIDDVFGHTLSNTDKSALATLIYYPKQKIELVKQAEPDIVNWYKITLYRLIEVCKVVSSKYTRSKVRKALPEDYGYIIEELITEKSEVLNKEAYYESIVNTIVEIGNSEEFIIALAKVIQQLVIDRLHILGDIFDRGPAPHLIMDRMCRYHSVDFQWGNHDILWMGAAAGHMACIANVIRNSVQYGNLGILEDGYGINMLPLATFALDTYADDPCEIFRGKTEVEIPANEIELNTKMHKAIAILQFKLEGQVINRHPEFKMQKRNLLDKINYEEGTITINGHTYELLDKSFPTIMPDDPYALTPEEEELMNRLAMNFKNCDKLQEHIRFMFNKGSMYLSYNGNLLYHGCVPIDKNGNFLEVQVKDKYYKGKGLYDILEYYVRKGYYEQEASEDHEYGKDIMWYIWSSENSPVFGKEKMATFERYFIADKATHEEKKTYYYQLIENEEMVNRIMEEFGMDPATAHIINGHMPVKTIKGESPVKCGGKVMIIDGGFSRAYHKTTGISGYTLIYNSYGLRLVAHEAFTSTEDVIEKEIDVHSSTVIRELSSVRERVYDTENGKKFREKIKDLEELLQAYRSGLILERE